MAVSILLIDNDLQAVAEIQLALAREGYDVQHAPLGRQAIRQLMIDQPALVVLTIDPDNEGDWKFCRRILYFLEALLLLLISNGNGMTRARGLNLGADACMLQPVLLPELKAQVSALLRRNLTPDARREQKFFVDDDLVVDLTRWEAKLDDEPVSLTPTEFLLLACLMKHAGEVVPHERLLVEAWGSDYEKHRTTLKQYIHHLRNKIEPDPEHPQRILTRWGKGYLFQRISAEA